MIGEEIKFIRAIEAVSVKADWIGSGSKLNMICCDDPDVIVSDLVIVVGMFLGLDNVKDPTTNRSTSREIKVSYANLPPDNQRKSLGFLVANYCNWS